MENENEQINRYNKPNIYTKQDRGKRNSKRQFFLWLLSEKSDRLLRWIFILLRLRQATWIFVYFYACFEWKTLFSWIFLFFRSVYTVVHILYVQHKFKNRNRHKRMLICLSDESRWTALFHFMSLSFALPTIIAERHTQLTGLILFYSYIFSALTKLRQSLFIASHTFPFSISLSLSIFFLSLHPLYS